VRGISNIHFETEALTAVLFRRGDIFIPGENGAGGFFIVWRITIQARRHFTVYELSGRRHLLCENKYLPGKTFYPRDTMLARVLAIATCLSVCPSVRLSRAGIVSKRRMLAA